MGYSTRGLTQEQRKILAGLPENEREAYVKSIQPETVMKTIRVYIVTCACGTMALNSNSTYEDACFMAQAHKDLTGKCEPTIFADDIPAGFGGSK